MRHQALLVALFFLLGLGLAAKPSFTLLLLLVTLSLPYHKKPLLLCFLLLCSFTAFVYGKFSLPSFPSNQKQFEGTAHFVPKEIKEHRSHFKKKYLVKGIISSMEGTLGEKASCIPCTLPLPLSLRPLNASEYLLQGTLEKTPTGFSFSLSSNVWTEEKKRHLLFTQLVEKRFCSKQKISSLIHTAYPDTRVADFLTALTVGNLNDSLLRFSFGRLGLQHILAISGFHFGLLALFLGGLLRHMLSEKNAHIALLACLTGYFLFLGSSPSITRTYLAALFYLIGRLGKWRTNSLNLFGVVLLLELLFFPRNITHLGFQLSFLATGSILFLFPLTSFWVEKIFPKRSKEQALLLTLAARWTYLFCCFLRTTFALNFAVHLTMIPVCLLYFGKFPLMSLAYNLFTPLAVSLSLFILFASFPLFLLCPPLASLLSICNQKFTARILTLIIEAPMRFDLYIRPPQIPEWLILIILLGIFSLPILMQKTSSANS